MTVPRMNRCAALALAATLACALPAAAREEPPPAVETPPAVDKVTNPVWISTPTGEDFAKLVPIRAQEKWVSGVVKLTCVVSEEGRLTGCKVVSAEPGGYSYEAASLKIVAKFRMKPVDKDGRPTAGRVFDPVIRWGMMHG